MNTSFQNIDAFKTLFQEHFNGLVNFVHSRYTKDWDDARDIVQTTFLKLWNNRERIQVNMSQKSYLYQACKNTALDRIRKYKNKQTIGLDDTLEINHIQEDVETHADSFYLKSKIVEALSSLKPKTRQIFELNKFEGLTYQEIADHMDISKRTVESNIAKALVILRDELKYLMDE